MAVLVQTTLGDFVIDLFVKERPRSCLNFVKLCKLKYYNFCLFHSIEEGYVAQTGDPTGTGRGGRSVFGHLFGDQADYFEMEGAPKMKHLTRGLVSFVNNGQDMHGSQFFITLADDQDYLDSKHTIFGQIGEGFEIIDQLNETICDETKRPYKDVRITHTAILDDPFDDPKGLSVPSRSPSPSAELLKNARIPVDEDIDDTKGKSAAEIQEEIEINEATARAHVLEVVGDLHHAEERPPENVLFICKLNAVTTSEDLEIIFSRFGPIKSCEVIKDKQTDHSLQYAFIEFEQEEHCENAYFKMDNVLIDDRRIHVDFSQSVAKNPKYPMAAKYARDDKPRPREQPRLPTKSDRGNDRARPPNRDTYTDADRGRKRPWTTERNRSRETERRQNGSDQKRIHDRHRDSNRSNDKRGDRGSSDRRQSAGGSSRSRHRSRSKEQRRHR